MTGVQTCALPIYNLLRFVQIKRFAQQMGVISITRDGARVILKMTATAKVDPNNLLRMIQENPQVKFSPNGVLSLPLKTHGPEVIESIDQLLRSLAAEPAA